MKKYFLTVPFIFFIVIMMIITSTVTFAKTDNTYKINSVNELKKTLNSNSANSLSQTELKKMTNPQVVEKFILEKQKKMEDVLANSPDITFTGSEEYHSQTYDLGDNCWVKFEFTDKAVPTLAERIKEFILPTANAFSKSGYKTGWQNYGDRSYTATATASYGVAWGEYNLEVNYTLGSNGIKITDETASNNESGLLKVSTEKCKTTDDVATKPGESDCDTYAIFKTSYGYSPIEWSRSHKMTLKIKYLAKDYVEKQIQTTRQWSINPY